MIYLIYLSIGYLAVTTLILLRNHTHFISLHPSRETRYLDQSPPVSICIPARNEEDTIERCVNTALKQSYPDFEVLVFDDGSTDRTGRILEKLQERHPHRLTVLKGSTKPDDWLGKPWACHQLSKTASGELLIFADADTWFEPDAIGRVVRSMGHDVIDFLTVWPRQRLETFWEKMIIPLIYYALLSLLPAYYVYRAPRWIPSFLKSRLAPYFAAACGQFLAFKRSAYERIGGHEAVKDEIVEDVALARRIKKSGFRMRMYYGADTVGCRMYNSLNEIKEGFRKNFLAGFGFNLPLFVLAGLLHIIVYVVPYLTLLAGIILGDRILLMLSGIPVLLILFHRLLISRWFSWNFGYGLLHPVSVLWFQWLAMIVLRDYYTGRRPEWKGRQV